VPNDDHGLLASPTSSFTAHPFELVGLFGPPMLPAELRARIAADVREAGADPLVEERLNATGQIPNFGAPAEFQAAIDHQRARIAAAAKDLGIVPTQ
jgi:tripartite-type tricarboxylate transporter receptor subunit TctC